MNILKLVKQIQQGFSLVEMMVAMGLISLAGVAVMSLSDNVNNNTVKAEAMMSKAQFASALGQHLGSSMGCEEVMNDTMPMGQTSSTEMVLSMWDVRNKQGQKVNLQKDVEFSHFKVKSLKGYLQPATGGATLPEVNIGGTLYRKTQARIDLVLTVPMNSARDYTKATRDYTYHYSVPVLVTTAGRIEKCDEEKSLSEACTAMQGNWNSTLETCELNTTCKLKGTFQQLTCTPSRYGCSTLNGTSRVNDLTGSYSCPDGLDPEETGRFTWEHQASCGKKCEEDITNTMKWYSCLDCGNSSGSGSGSTTTSGGSSGGGSYGGSGGGSSGGFTRTQIR